MLSLLVINTLLTNEATSDQTCDLELLEIINQTSSLHHLLSNNLPWNALSLTLYDFKEDVDIRVAEDVPVVMYPDDDCFPEIYYSDLLGKPWLSDRYTMILSSSWGQ
ncbi:hypothetical protein Tco_0596234 [Tanacetum coccineum]